MKIIRPPQITLEFDDESYSAVQVGMPSTAREAVIRQGDDIINVPLDELESFANALTSFARRAMEDES